MSSTDYCPVKGGKLYYEVLGEGEALVLIHAGIAHAAMWDAQMEAFSRHYQVIRYDLRAMGKSTSEAVPFSNHEDLNDLLEHLNISRVNLCGISMGGKVALEYTLAYPEKVKSLIMIATGLMNDPEQRDQEKQLFETMETLEEAGKWQDVAEIDVRLFIDGPNSSEGRADEAVRLKVKEMALTNYLMYEESYPTEDTEPEPLGLTPPAVERLKEVQVPTLSMVGNLDISRARFTSKVFAREIPNVKQIIIQDTAHLPSMEKPGLFNKHVLEFLNQV